MYREPRNQEKYFSLPQYFTTIMNVLLKFQGMIKKY